MRDEVFGRYDECPNCGKSKGLFYTVQYPLEVDIRLDGKELRWINGRRTTEITQKYRANRYQSMIASEFQVAHCSCELCGWVSDPITP